MDSTLQNHDLIYNAIPERWIDGIMHGNGDIGVILWKQGTRLFFTLDKYDIWEERSSWDLSREHTYKELKALIKNKQFAKAKAKYEIPRANSMSFIYRTRLPIPRFELEIKENMMHAKGRLNLWDACVSINSESNRSAINLEYFVHATKNLILIKIDSIPYRNDILSAQITRDHWKSDVKERLKAWGYPDPIIGLDSYGKSVVKKKYNYYFQESAGEVNKNSYFIAYRFFEVHPLIFISILFISAEDLSKNSINTPKLQDYKKYAEKMFEEIERDQYEEVKREHTKWWHEYWKKSRIIIPDNIMENLYYIELYKIACNARNGKYPITLQGIWTVDGQMPPWSGDFHLDMNVQESYWGIFTANRLELGEPLYRKFMEFLPKFKKNCQDFFGFDGAMARCAYSLGGNNVHGYYTTENWFGNGPWVAHLFWLHYKYSNDKEFLKNICYPFMIEFFKLYKGILERNEFGELSIQITNSPEYEENQPSAWGKNDTANISLIRFLCAAILESEKIIGESLKIKYSEQAKSILDELVEYPADFEGLMVMENRPLQHSHRHFSHLMPIYPLGLLDSKSEDKDIIFLIKSSLQKIEKLGDYEWTGWSFPWISCIYSRAENRILANFYAKQYMRYIRENSMHVNGDSYSVGFSLFKYDPMTLEAGFCFIAAINEMLLQSHNGSIRIFPATHPAWRSIYFQDLRAEGGFLISASMVDGKLIWVSIFSEKQNDASIWNGFSTPIEIIRNNSNIPEMIIESNQRIITLSIKEKEKILIRSTVYYEKYKNFDHKSDRIFNGTNFFGHQTKSKNIYLSKHDFLYSVLHWNCLKIT